jgi:hypothetical protein
MKKAEHETTYGLSPEKLAELLRIGLEGGEQEPSSPPRQTPADLLEAMLAETLSLDPASPDSLPAVLDLPPEESPAALDRRAMGDLLLDPGLAIPDIRMLKDYCKQRAALPGLEARRPAATVLYYAAIANALVFHGQSITRHSFQKLHQAYAELIAKPWMPSDLRTLFQKAEDACRKQEEKPE